MNIGVIGAGIIGLSSAVAIQERLVRERQQSPPTPAATATTITTTSGAPGCCRVTIVADKFNSHTTSWGSGGQIVPFCPTGIPRDVAQKWCDDSADHFYGLAFSAQASTAGVNLLSGSFLTVENHAHPLITTKCLNVKQMTAEDLKYFGVVFKNGYTATTATVELPIYMEWLMKKFLDNGGRVVKKHVTSLEELSGQYDVIVNCSGMGSKTLANDPLMVPIRGQAVHVKAPWIKNFVCVDNSMHVFPFRDSVFVGSVKQVGRDDMTISVSDTEGILSRAQKVFPPLKGAQIMWEWVGVRPYRETIRVEQETVTTHQGKKLKVVHNYGHGSFGVSLSWGTAVHAAELVNGILNNKPTCPSKL